MTKHTSQRRDAESYLIALLSYETAISDFFNQNGIAFQDGEACRVIDIVVQAPDGIFDRRKKGNTSKAEVAALKSLLLKQHGNVTPAWATYLADLSIADLKMKFNMRKAAFVRRRADLDNVESRILDVFAQIYAAGAIASEAKLLPLSIKGLRRRIMALFEANILARKSRQKSDDEVTKRVRANLLKLSHFPKLKHGQDPTNSVAKSEGFRRIEASGRFLYIRLEHLQKVAADDHILKEKILNPMQGKGVILPQGGELTASVKQGSMRQRYLRFDIAKLKSFYGQMV